MSRWVILDPALPRRYDMECPKCNQVRSLPRTIRTWLMLSAPAYLVLASVERCFGFVALRICSMHALGAEPVRRSQKDKGVIYFQPAEDKMELLFVCCNEECRHNWR